MEALIEIIQMLQVNKIDIDPIPIYEEGIGYNFYLVNDDKCKKQYILQLTIIKEDLLEACEIQKQINNILLTLGDETKSTVLLGIMQNGGGVLFDDTLKKYKLKATYIVATKG